MLLPLLATSTFGVTGSTVTLQSEDFDTDLGNIVTPGDDAEPNAGAWVRVAEGGTPSSGTGPAGGSNPANQQVEVTGNGYLVAESGSGDVSPLTFESDTFDASLGLLVATFDFHAHVNTANNCTFTVRGWNGSAWINLGTQVFGGVQTTENDDYILSTSFGTYNSQGFSNADFKFGVKLDKETVDGDRFQYDVAIDNWLVRRVPSTGQSSGTRAEAILNGLRTIFVSKTGSDSNDGLSESTPKLTGQAAFDIAQAGDSIIFENGIWDEELTLSDISATAQIPILIAARNPGQAIIANVWTQARDTPNGLWTNEGNGVYSASRSQRPYMGYDPVAGDFLFYYDSQDDLEAETITAFSAIAGSNRTITKPPYGFAFDNNRVYVRLRNNANPNNQSLLITADFSTILLTVDNCDNYIFDGLKFIGAGNVRAVEQSSNSTFGTWVNCVFEMCRHGIRTRANTYLYWCTFQYLGYDRWRRDVLALDGKLDYGPFVLAKGYYTGALTGTGGGFGNANLEGSIDYGFNTSPPTENVTIDFCKLGPVFEGCRLGEQNNSVVKNCVIVECGDDGIQNEGPLDHPSDNNEIHDCLFRNNFRDVSRQGDDIDGVSYLYRCIMEHTESDVQIPNSYALKYILTTPESEDFIYHCIFNFDAGVSSGGSQRVWTDFGGSSSADEIERFFNNICIFPRDFSNGSGGDPQIIENNVTVGPSAGNVSLLTGTGGVYAGNDISDLDINADYTLQGTSPAKNAGRSLPGGLPDSRVGGTANDDAGVFIPGEIVPAEWPRPTALTYTDEVPRNWTQPGLAP